MAIFGVVDDDSDGAEAAVDAALRMQTEIAAINVRRGAGGSEAIGFGVGIHTGEVVLGAVGIPQRSDFTAIGDTVNTASRLEGQCKEYGVSLVLSEETARRLGPDAPKLRELGTTTIRGRQEPVKVFTVSDASTEVAGPIAASAVA
jgi:class 3 adenylate cyclase